MLIRSITQNAIDKKISIRQFPSPEHSYIAFPQKNLAVLDISRFTFCKVDYIVRLFIPPHHHGCFSRDNRQIVERGSSAVECRARNHVSPGSNPPLLPFRRLGIFVLSIDAPVDSAV